MIMPERVLRAALLTLLVIADSAPRLATQSQALAFSIYPAPAPDRVSEGSSRSCIFSAVGDFKSIARTLSLCKLLCYK